MTHSEVREEIINNINRNLKQRITGPVLQDVLLDVCDDYQVKLVSGENIKTVNGESLLGEGDMELVAQKDWDQNDPDNGEYIKNRTHYRNQETTTLKDFFNDIDIITISNTTFTVDPDAPSKIPFVSQDEYKFDSVIHPNPRILIVTDLKYVVENSPYSIIVHGTTTTGGKFIPKFQECVSYQLEDSYVNTNGEETIYTSTVIKKLDNKYLNLDDHLVEGSPNLITSGAVYDALSNVEGAIPDWEAHVGEGGYIENRTHWAERENIYMYNWFSFDGQDVDWDADQRSFYILPNDQIQGYTYISDKKYVFESKSDPSDVIPFTRIYTYGTEDGQCEVEIYCLDNTVNIQFNGVKFIKHIPDSEDLTYTILDPVEAQGIELIKFEVIQKLDNAYLSTDKGFWLASDLEAYNPKKNKNTYFQLDSSDETATVKRLYMEEKTYPDSVEKYDLIHLDVSAPLVKQSETTNNNLYPLSIAGRQYQNMESGKAYQTYYSKDVQVNPHQGTIHANDAVLNGVSALQAMAGKQDKNPYLYFGTDLTAEQKTHNWKVLEDNASPLFGMISKDFDIIMIYNGEIDDSAVPFTVRVISIFKTTKDIPDPNAPVSEIEIDATHTVTIEVPAYWIAFWWSYSVLGTEDNFISNITTDGSLTFLNPEQISAKRLIYNPIGGKLTLSGTAGVESEQSNISGIMSRFSTIDAAKVTYMYKDYLSFGYDPNPDMTGAIFDDYAYDVWFRTEDKLIRLRVYGDDAITAVTTTWWAEGSNEKSLPILYICDQDDQITSEEADHNLAVLDQLAEQISDYKGQINIPVKLVFRWNDDAGDDNGKIVEYKTDGNILALEKSHGDSDTYYLAVEYKSCNYDEPMVLERTINLITDNDEQDGDNGRLFYYYPNILKDTYVLNHPINISVEILGSVGKSEGVEIVVDMPFPIIARTFHILPYDIVNEYMRYGMMPQYSIGAGILSYNFGGGASSTADGDLYDDVDYYQVFFDYNDKIIRLRVYDNQHVTTMWKSKSSSPTNNVVIYELWNKKNISVPQSVQSTPTRGGDAPAGTILEGDPEHLYQGNWFNVGDYNTNNNMLTEAITNFLNGKTVILYDSTSDGLYMNVIAAASLEEPVRTGGGAPTTSTPPRMWPHSPSVGLVCINPYNMKKVVWTYIVAEVE